MRVPFFILTFGLLAICILLAVSPGISIFWYVALGVSLTILVGVYDVTQKKRAVLRNFPVIGHLRYLLEEIRPEINQYFIESNTDGAPFNREQRSVVYQRAKLQLDTLPFGTQRDVYETGYEWIAHSMCAKKAPKEEPRVLIGAETCAQPYSASLLNISAMSFGSLSDRAIQALSSGAQRGGFYHNTGEGGVSPYHLAGGGDLVWQIGTGYFGCRTPRGEFDLDMFARTASHSQVKMIEVKLSQGAKPGHGGILPAAKVTREISEIRGVPMGADVLSPPAHTAFSSPRELLSFLCDLRKASGGKPVGFKLCIGRKREFMAICKAMQETGRHPDFITVDGGEGGTGAAPFEFSNSVGMPLNEGLVFVHNCLVGYRLRDKVKLIAAGKIATGFNMASKFALGADVCNSARAMMMAVGCIQARRCNSNKCPVGVATQLPHLVAGIDVESKAARVENYHRETVESFLELVGAAGLDHPSELSPEHIHVRVDRTTVSGYDEIYSFLQPGALLTDPVPVAYEQSWMEARSSAF